MTSTIGALRLDVVYTVDGWVAVCDCGYATEPFVTRAMLQFHIEHTWGRHIREAHAGDATFPSDPQDWTGEPLA